MQLWHDFVAKQEKEFGKETVNRWLRSLILKKFDARNIYLEAKDSFQVLWFEEHIRPKLGTFVNNNQRPIKIHILLPGSDQKRIRKNVRAADQICSLFFEKSDPTSTFEEFIVTTENKITYTILQELVAKLQKIRLGEPLQELINPVYLYGPEGSGKTHLLMAFANKLKAMGYNAIYARGDTFTEHFVKSIRSGEMTYFRTLYRNADVLIIDDIHTFSRKAATQEEFFHTFNALHTLNKQIILSSNVSPQFLQLIEPRLVSRCEWGIVLELKPLQGKEIVQLIEKKARLLRMPLLPRIVAFLAESFPNSPYTAVKALQALALRSHLVQGRKVHDQNNILAHVKAALADIIEEDKTRALTPQKIIKAVAERYGITIEDITGKSQARECVIPRQISMYLCRKYLKMPYIKIGDQFSRDHSTVMSSIRHIEKSFSCNGSDVASTIKIIELELVK